MKSAKVAISVMGDEGRQHLCLRGLQNASGFLQSRIADRIDTRYTPRLTFSLDTGLKKSQEVNRILAELARERQELGDADEGHETGDESSSRELGADVEPTSDPYSTASQPKPPPASTSGAETNDAES
jgi:ribosome-binding factor A